jgi:8-oxo-dGTP pyrophosphatase MutT (NUDIX family)
VHSDPPAPDDQARSVIVHAGPEGGYRADLALRERLVANLARFELASPSPSQLRRAAVAVAVVAGTGGEACFLLTERSASLRHHAGQWALPGGRLDADESVEEAALRELREEVGLKLGPAAVLGRLDDYGTRSGFAISPVVLWGGEAGALEVNPSEVAAVHLFPLSYLDQPAVPRLSRIPESDREVIEVPLGVRESIYAPTGAILYQLREVAMHGRSTRVGHFDQPLFAWQ